MGEMHSLLNQLDRSINSQRERIRDAEREIARLTNLRVKYGGALSLLSSSPEPKASDHQL